MDNLNAGDKIKFIGEKQRYNVRACSERFAICTKPFNPKRTVIYTIIDFEQGLRNRDNMVFGDGYETDEQCRNALIRLESGDLEISHRSPIPIGIEQVYAK